MRLNFTRIFVENYLLSKEFGVPDASGRTNFRQFSSDIVHFQKGVRGAVSGPSGTAAQFHKFSSEMVQFRIRSAQEFHKFSVNNDPFSKKKCAAISQMFVTNSHFFTNKE